MRAAGSIVRRMIEAMKRAVRPGVTTAQLDEVGAAVMRGLGGQGSARPFHEERRMTNYAATAASQILTECLVITVEPIIAAGSGRAIVAKDGWTVCTADRRPSAHYEHTLVITKGEPILLTAA